MSASSGTCHRGGTNKSNPEERSGRLRCDFSSCRQWRHTIDQCWKAHPELRPCSHGRRRLVNGALTNYSKTNTFDLANRARAPPAHFRFLDLPAELQNRIYEEAYKEPHTLTIVETSDPNLPYGNATVRFTRSAPHNLHAACQKTFNDTTHLLGNGGFDGHLRCADGPIDWFNYDDRWTELRSQVTKITFFGFTPASMHFRNFGRSQWDYIHGTFPKIKEIHVEWTRTAYRFVQGTNKQTEEWKALWKPDARHAFLEGGLDHDDRYTRIDYKTAVDRLKLWHLEGRLRGRIDCKVFVTGILQWLGHGRKVLYLQKIKAEVTEGGGLQVVDRWAYKP